jgi:hypothetical protein
MSKSSRLSSRAPGFSFLAIAGLLGVLIAAAFNPAQPPPPPVAQYAPEAVHEIVQPPPQQSSAFGNGHGNGAAGAGARRHHSPPPPPRRPGVPGGGGGTQTVPDVLDCVGNPPQQIPDPESPPCVPYWKGNNGGATSAGVTGKTIKIAIPDAGRVQQFVDFFNQRFEFYGRHIEFVTPSTSCSSPADMRASADQVAQLNVFAVVGSCDALGTEYFFYDELAAHHIVSVANRPGVATEAMLAAHNPYEWTWFPTFDEGQTQLGDLVCALAHHDAQWAGPPYNAPGTIRKFGLFTNYYDGAPPPDTSEIRTTLQNCGVTPISAAIDAPYNGGTAEGANSVSTPEITNALVKMRDAGVTSLIDLVHTSTTEQILHTASGMGYQPEQIVSSYLYNDNDLFMSEFPQDQTAHVLGVTEWNKFVHVADEPWYYAAEEGDPGFTWTYAPLSYYDAWYGYWPLLVLAAGIQMAGPDLTPSTFARGLQMTHFPNPINFLHEGIVSIHPGQHSYVNDASIEWFDPNMPEADYGASGSFCYAFDGERFSNAGFPGDAPFPTYSDLAKQMFTLGQCQRYN